MIHTLLASLARVWRRHPCFERTVDRLLRQARLVPRRRSPKGYWLCIQLADHDDHWVELAPRDAHLRMMGLTRLGFAKGQTPSALLEELLVRNRELNDGAWQLLAYGPYMLCTIAATLPLDCEPHHFCKVLEQIVTEQRRLAEFCRHRSL